MGQTRRHVYHHMEDLRNLHGPLLNLSSYHVKYYFAMLTIILDRYYTVLDRYYIVLDRYYTVLHRYYTVT